MVFLKTQVYLLFISVILGTRIGKIRKGTVLIIITASITQTLMTIILIFSHTFNVKNQKLNCRINLKTQSSSVLHNVFNKYELIINQRMGLNYNKVIIYF